MQIRTAILVAGTALAIVAPTAAASNTKHVAQTHTAYRWDSATYNWVAVAQSTAGLFSPRIGHAANGLGPSKANGQKIVERPKRPPTYPVTRIVEPMLPAGPVAPAPDPNACESSMVGCGDQQLCEIWGANCDVWAAEEAAQARAANEQQAAADQTQG